tara:strand:- start:56 stop:343 length:288 start_codon:yes stop_codon:yes gene_type:complete
MKLKKDYEDTFKEGFRLGLRLTRAKECYVRAADAKSINDVEMSEFWLDAGRKWMDLARNAGRNFTPSTAHDPEQPALDFGDRELLVHNEPFKETG